MIRGKFTANRFGVMLKFKDEKQSGTKNDWSGYAVVSREALGEWEDRRPRLLVVEESASNEFEKGTE